VVECSTEIGAGHVDAICPPSPVMPEVRPEVTKALLSPHYMAFEYLPSNAEDGNVSVPDITTRELRRGNQITNR
jgi:hypothetical protein